MLSYWEKRSFVTYDYIVVGAGITGLSVACELKEQHATANVLVLERGLLPTGASTKNAGFACIGSLSENLHDIGLMGENGLVKLVQNRYEGLQILRDRLGDTNIGYEACGGYEIVLQGEDNDFIDKLDDMNVLLYPLFNKNIFSLCNEKISEFGLSTAHANKLIHNAEEGQIDTGKMMNSLWMYAQRLGVKIITGAELKTIDESTQGVSLATQEITFYAQKVFICTNAFTKSLFPNLEIKPGRGQVLVTKPIQDLKVKGTFFFDEGYYYFKNFEDRIIFGGGRNLDFENESTLHFGSNQKILAQLNTYLKELILPHTPYEIDYTWSGIMAFGSNKLPIVEQISQRQFLGVRLNGMGVALGSKIAKDLVNMAK
jgi:glycine/D-amino acid oxidase-like deaminating enzyme